MLSVPFWLAMAGWAFTYLNSRLLARQSEANGIVTAVDKLLQDISDENYKFWRDADSESEEHVMKCQLFHAFINFRCNMIEIRIAALHEKCSNRVFFDANADNFKNEAVELIGKIRSFATLDSERSSELDPHLRQKKVLLLNKSTLQLHDVISTFILERYRSIVDLRGLRK
ncbi:hypothetical protein [Metapseudomonas otitidis]|uniref:hypothetical protein n=1 Tax=Metapseudomonas otitidis TaxID=319939 RepID=UPI0011140F44|nr:hypothetical protein [Pseudomonas otitidis]